MDIEKQKKYFEKRFERQPENVSFVGMPLAILKSENSEISASLSVGGYALSAKRKDGRINIEYKDAFESISCNTADFSLYQNKPEIEFLQKLKKQGASISGADILIGYNNTIYNDFKALLMSVYASENICNLVDRVNLIGRKNALLFRDAETELYLPFCNSLYKIILCKTDGRSKKAEPQGEYAVKMAKDALIKQDYEAFGHLITEASSRQKMSSNTKKLFNLAVKLNDAIGYGVINDCGIFAIVKENMADTFVHNLSEEYKKKCGSAPEFYVTDTENSGIFAKGSV